MSIREELKEYCRLCLDDVRVSEYEDYISCKKHKFAVRRFMRDIEKEETDPGYPYYFDEDAAQNIVDWFALLRHSKGVLSGQPIRLTIWQKFLLCQLYGWRRKEDSLKRFKRLFAEVARKNAKSQMLAGVLLYEIAVSSTKNDEVYEAYTAGVKREQSKIVFEEAGLMLRNSPLYSRFNITRNVITHRKSGSFIKTLSKEDGKKGDGTNIAILCVDELHQHPTMEFVDLFLGANTKDPTLAIITTAGVDLTYPCYTVEYAYVSKVLDPDVDVEDESYLIDIMEMEPELAKDLDNVGIERYWHMANPIRMSYRNGQEKIRDSYNQAKIVPEKMTAFLTKCMNIWVQAKENGYMDMAKWAACQVEELPIDTKGMPVYVGFDMSAKIDLTSVAFVVPFLSGEMDQTGVQIVKYIVSSHSFIPNREKLAERKAVDKVDYDAWEREGFLSVTDTPIVDQNAVMQYVLDTCTANEWKIQTLCVDPANASKLMMDLSEQGYEVEEVYQSHKSLNESTQGFREQVYSGNILYLYNPLLNYAMSNAVIRRSNGLIKIDKDASTKRIDPVDAVLCGYKLAMYHDFGLTNLEDALDEFLESDW
ncbi:MAG: terminase large subunit [Clostridiales bacterium]|nr:terminase large subunit [Clostridiales bacterium]